MNKKDKLYGIKVESHRLSTAISYCKDNNISLTMEIRQVIDKYWKKGEFNNAQSKR